MTYITHYYEFPLKARDSEGRYWLDGADWDCFYEYETGIDAHIAFEKRSEWLLNCGYAIVGDYIAVKDGEFWIVENKLGASRITEETLGI